jgi:hypothetical protein
LGIGKEWHHVNTDGRMGFIKSEFVKDAGKVSEYVIAPVQSPIRVDQ